MQCAKKECKNEAVVYPRILATVKGYDGESIKAVIKLPLCFSCKTKTKLKDVMTDEGWGILRTNTLSLGFKSPTRKLTKLDFIDIDDGEAIFKDNIKSTSL